MRRVNLPAGLEDRNIEIYINDGKLRAICCGTVLPFESLPHDFIEVLSAAMISDKKAVKSMIKDLGIVFPEKMLEKYIMCNFGNFDGVPDVTVDGVILRECWDCGHRGSCPAEGKVCSRIQGPNGLLTKRETEIFFMVVEGKQDKEIAARFDISINTVITLLKRIRECLGINNRVEMMSYAIKRKLITF